MRGLMGNDGFPLTEANVRARVYECRARLHNSRAHSPCMTYTQQRRRQQQQQQCRTHKQSKKKVKNRNQILENGTKFGVNLQHPEAVNPTHNPMSHIIIQRSFRTISVFL